MKILSTLMIFLALLLFTMPVFSKNNVKGTVHYNNINKTPLAGINVFLKDLEGKIIATDISNPNGKFNFKNIKKGTYTLGAYSDLTFNLADLSDAFLILEYLDEHVEFDALQLLAADINQDGTVDMLDYTNIMNWLCSEGESFNIGSLIFQEKEIVVEENQLKSNSDAETTTTIESTTSGDPNHIEDPKPTIKTGKSSLKVDFEDISIFSRILPIYLTSSEQVNGYGIVLNVKNALSNVVEVLSNNENLNYEITEHQIRIFWMNLNSSTLNPTEPIIKLRLNPDSDALQFELDESSHIIGVEGKKIEGTLTLPKMTMNEIQSELSPIFPNPVQETATIRYRLSEQSKVNLSIYNTNGQLVSVLVDKNQSKGNHEVALNVANLNLQSGNYVYRINCSGEYAFSDAKILIVR